MTIKGLVEDRGVTMTDGHGEFLGSFQFHTYMKSELTQRFGVDIGGALFAAIVTCCAAVQRRAQQVVELFRARMPILTQHQTEVV